MERDPRPRILKFHEVWEIQGWRLLLGDQLARFQNFSVGSNKGLSGECFVLTVVAASGDWAIIVGAVDGRGGPIDGQLNHHMAIIIINQDFTMLAIGGEVGARDGKGNVRIRTTGPKLIVDCKINADAHSEK